MMQTPTQQMEKMRLLLVSIRPPTYSWLRPPRAHSTRAPFHIPSTRPPPPSKTLCRHGHRAAASGLPAAAAQRTPHQRPAIPTRGREQRRHHPSTPIIISSRCSSRLYTRPLPFPRARSWGVPAGDARHVQHSAQGAGGTGSFPAAAAPHD